MRWAYSFLACLSRLTIGHGFYFETEYRFYSEQGDTSKYLVSNYVFATYQIVFCLCDSMAEREREQACAALRGFYRINIV